MLSKREKEKKFDGQSQHFIYYYYPSTKKTHSSLSLVHLKVARNLLSSPLLSSARRRHCVAVFFARRAWPLAHDVQFIFAFVSYRCL